MMEYTGGYDDDEAAEDHQLEPAGHHADGAGRNIKKNLNSTRVGSHIRHSI